MKRPWILLVGLLPACGAPPQPAAADSQSEQPSRCEVKPAISATAKPTPRALSCNNKAEITQATDACNGGDAAMCYVTGVCFAVEVLALGKEPERRARAVELGKKAFRVACDGGIADGCNARAGLIEDQKTNQAARKEACEDVVRGCQLGKQVNCAECLACGG